MMRHKISTSQEPDMEDHTDLDEEKISDIEESEDEDFYTPGSQQLYDCRVEILHSSLNKASSRVEKLRSKVKNQDFIKTLKHRRNINKQLGQFELYGSQLIPGNTRAVSAVRFSPDSSLIACGSWDGLLYILDKNDLPLKSTLSPGYHTEKLSAVDWNPVESNMVVTGGQEGNINIWDVNTTSPRLKPILSIKSAHENRIMKTLFHPSGKYIASTSLDQTWKLWDPTKPKEPLLQQEGHSKEVFPGAFHPDGSLFATGGLDAIGRIWDLRSGRSITTLQQHIKGIYSMDWSPNGHHLATASGDCSVKIWDLRKLDHGSKEIFSIPAHTKLVSDVRFFKRRQPDSLSKPVTNELDEDPEILDSDGTFLVTSSYDGLVNLWSADNWVLTKSLRGHSDKIMSCDINGDGSSIVSSGWDRSVKLWLRI